MGAGNQETDEDGRFGFQMRATVALFALTNDVLYKNYITFRNKANVIIDTTCRIPFHEFALLDITAPSMLENQPVLIESIVYTLPLANEDQKVRLRTLREQEPDTSIQ